MTDARHAQSIGPTGATGAAGAALKINSFSGPTARAGAGTTGATGATRAGPAPVVPPGPDGVGPENPNENNVVPAAPAAPVRKGKSGQELLDAVAALVHRGEGVRPEAGPEADLDAFEERAAIAEYDGGLPLDEAEALAARDQGFDDVTDLFATAARLAEKNGDTRP